MRDQINTQIQTRVSSVYLVMDGVTCLDSGHVVTVHTWCFDQNWYFCVCERVLQFFLDTVWNLDFNIWSQWLWWWLVGVAVGGAEAGLLISDARSRLWRIVLPCRDTIYHPPPCCPLMETHTHNLQSLGCCVTTVASVRVFRRSPCPRRVSPRDPLSARQRSAAGHAAGARARCAAAGWWNCNSDCS